MTSTEPVPPPGDAENQRAENDTEQIPGLPTESGRPPGRQAGADVGDRSWLAC